MVLVPEDGRALNFQLCITFHYIHLKYQNVLKNVSSPKATSVVEEREQAPTWNSALLSIIAVLPVVALTAAVLCAVVACTRRRAKAGMQNK